MDYRVIPYAEQHGYTYYKALPDRIYDFGEKYLGEETNKRLNVWVNKKWLNFQIMEGKQLVDIGAPHPALRPAGVPALEPSAYYDAEHAVLSGTVGRHTVGGQYQVDPQPLWDLRQ